MKRAQADALARLLEGDPAPGGASAEAVGLARLAGMISVPLPSPPEEFSQDLRARLLHDARGRAAPRPQARPPIPVLAPAHRLLVLGTAVALLVLVILPRGLVATGQQPAGSSGSLARRLSVRSRP